MVMRINVTSANLVSRESTQVGSEGMFFTSHRLGGWKCTE
ncbi:hypothetical protein CEXT_475021, partial [Caerostris extrusa]